MATSRKISVLQAAANLMRRKKNRTYVASLCGHTTRLIATVQAFDYKAEVELPQNERQLPMYCASCLGKLSIRCAWCCRPIFVGDPVTLHKTKDDFLVPDESQEFSYAPLRLVGCMHEDCADISDPMSGFWRIDSRGKCVVGEIEETKAIFSFRFNARRRVIYKAPVKKPRKR